jgi:superfamily II DNA or RNA helicase
LERIETGIAEIYAKVVDQIEAAASKRPELAAAAKAELASTRGVLLGGVTVAQLAKDPEALRGSKARVAKLCESDGLLDAAIKEGSVSRRIVAQTIADSVTDDEQVLLFSQFTSHLRLIERELRREHGVEAALYTGDTPKRERHGVKRAFREGRSRVVLVGPIGEEGHNIQPAAEACVVVHYDLPWVATSFEQRTGRAARPGSGADQIAVLVPLLRRSIEMRVATILLPRAAKSIEALSREGELEPMAVQLEDVAGQLQAELGDREEASARLRVCQMIFAEHASKAKRGG